MSLKVDLLQALPFTAQELDVLIATAPRRYKEYTIEKRNKTGRRNIAQPTPEIKTLQRWLSKNVLSNFPIHASATAYRTGVGLAQNISPHLNNRFLLKIDFQNFFPSITSDDLLAYLEKRKEFTDDDRYVLTQILFKRDAERRKLTLAVGAPSSPQLSNILLFQFDEDISAFCIENKIAYTRYADDLSFSTSTPEILRGCLNTVRQILRDLQHPRLLINDGKTVETSKKRGRRITGLTITNEGAISVGRLQKRELRVLIHRFLNGHLDACEQESLRGYLAFLYSVEPTHIERLKASFGASTLASLL
ncbi:retron St85 family RNA-directed DNA polymerase [Paralcaligenes sp. KSB-10]|uniref:retron St85 family RNA-directed DNA polymerase n=1 Tax=Paralcaligenes sp. KSB-10 TaxID=2901142 RepID=UPI001E2D9196|nr:retron St85 family RNA-directed DNA polymerase [Paralcaligenes sp. KSB-10]UHL64071.1 retron St85 family RNA-directed DNA polymerase [Paralcaligenes sp. KSB-10]